MNKVMKNLNSFFSPKSIAVVGASPKKGKLGNVLFENIKRGGWKGKIYLVNPKYTKSRLEYFSTLQEIKKPVDLALIAIPAQFVKQALEDGIKAKFKISNFVIISSGFKESGPSGKILENSLENLAKKHDLNILGPNCLGFANPQEKLNATFTDVRLREGNIAIVSQSGALAVALLDWAANKQIGFSKIISIGNKAVLDESEIINFLAQDKDTKAIALYLEDIQNGSKFMRAVAKNASKKPIIVLKAGKTAAGQRAVSSHTGSLAQDQDIVVAVFEKLNIVSADNIEEFEDLIYYLNFNPLPPKKEVIVVTNAGGPGVMASDFAGKSENIQLQIFSDDFKNEIKKNLPVSSSVENPIDVIGDAPPERYQKTIEKIAEKYPANPLVALLTPQNQTYPERVAQILARLKRKIPSLSACFMGGEKINRAQEILERNKIANFENPERALATIEKLVKYFVIASEAKQSRAIQSNTGLPRRSTPRNDMAKVLKENRKMLFWRETEKLFRDHGIKLSDSISFENISELKAKKIFFPCVLKTDDPSIAHRLEKGAVALNIKSKKELENIFKKIKKTTGAKHFLIQPMAPEGLELIIGMKRDSTFGPVILCGWGGSLTELFKDRIILIPPFGQSGISHGLSKLKIFPLLKGFRGKKGYNLEEISKILVAVSKISSENSEIQEIDINPLVVYNDAKKGQILDAKIFIKKHE
jgi:acetate---CoA ligase (ADP-forming)